MQKKDSYGLAQKALACLDLTSLNDTDRDTTVKALCAKAHTANGDVAAICIWSGLIPEAKKWLPKGVSIATVVNFPQAESSVEDVVVETLQAINRGANEIDLVFPYKKLILGDIVTPRKMVAQVKKAISIANPSVKLKVILETGYLEGLDDGLGLTLIENACQICIEEGADFIKTSTGKVAAGASLKAVEIIAKAIKANQEKYPNVGLKISGGVRTFEDAASYMQLVEAMLGQDFLKPSTFRFGASSLLDHLLNKLNGLEYTLPDPSGNSGFEY